MPSVHMNRSTTDAPKDLEDQINWKLEYMIGPDPRPELDFQTGYTVEILGELYYLVDVKKTYGQRWMRLVKRNTIDNEDPFVIEVPCSYLYAQDTLVHLIEIVGF